MSTELNRTDGGLAVFLLSFSILVALEKNGRLGSA
jgi:hypothetical protein